VTRILFISILFCISLIYADSFKLQTKANKNPVSSSKHLNVQSEKEVVSTGYGRNEKEALKHAFNAAVEQYVGIVIDSETLVQNGKLIKDEIITASNGYIQNYNVLSTKNDDGFFEVTIKASVKSQKIFEKITNLNIATITSENAIGIFKNIKNAHARLTTNLSAKEDASKLLKKAIDDFLAPESLKEMLTVTITDAKIEEEKVKKYKVPFVINYEMRINYEMYLQKIKKLEQVFENLGASLKTRYDLPYVENDLLKVKNIDSIKKLVRTDVGFITKYGKNYKLDLWSFPQKWKDTYIFSLNSTIYWTDIFQIILEVKKKNGEVIMAENISQAIYDKPMVSVSPSSTYGYYGSGFKKSRAKIISPLFGYKEKLLFQSRQIVDIEDSIDIDSITVELDYK